MRALLFNRLIWKNSELGETRNQGTVSKSLLGLCEIIIIHHDCGVNNFFSICVCIICALSLIPSPVTGRKTFGEMPAWTRRRGFTWCILCSLWGQHLYMCGRLLGICVAYYEDEDCIIKQLGSTLVVSWLILFISLCGMMCAFRWLKHKPSESSSVVVCSAAVVIQWNFWMFWLDWANQGLINETSEFFLDCYIHKTAAFCFVAVSCISTSAPCLMFILLCSSVWSCLRHLTSMQSEVMFNICCYPTSCLRHPGNQRSSISALV